MSISKNLDSIEMRMKSIEAVRDKNTSELASKKKQLADLLERVKRAGYDPNNLKVEKEKLESQIAGKLDEFQKLLDHQEETLKQFLDKVK